MTAVWGRVGMGFWHTVRWGCCILYYLFYIWLTSLLLLFLIFICFLLWSTELCLSQPRGFTFCSQFLLLVLTWGRKWRRSCVSSCMGLSAAGPKTMAAPFWCPVWGTKDWGNEIPDQSLLKQFCYTHILDYLNSPCSQIVGPSLCLVILYKSLCSMYSPWWCLSSWGKSTGYCHLTTVVLSMGLSWYLDAAFLLSSSLTPFTGETEEETLSFWEFWVSSG